MPKVHLLIIDPQNDFSDPKGSLFVPGADADMRRLAAFIRANGHRFEDISCTLDSHQTVHIAHPIFWINDKGQHPTPFTTISVDDVTSGKWKPKNPHWIGKATHYVQQLAANKRYQLTIWPPHCIIGSWGQSLVPDVSDALITWERQFFAAVNYVTKGSNFGTEHYSAVQADVPDDTDPTTKLNTDLISVLSEADEILATGEALSHCLANTVTDIATVFGDEHVKKFTLLTDTASSVPTCEGLSKTFIDSMVAKGMRLATTQSW